VRKSEKRKKREVKDSPENKTTTVDIKQCLQAGKTYKRKKIKHTFARKKTSKWEIV
jgi:hypothetical protein